MTSEPVLWERRKMSGIVFVIVSAACVSIVLGTNCVYWVADEHGMVMNQVVARAGVNFSLHGAYDIKPDYPETCTNHQKFLNEFYWYQSEGALVHFMEASPRTKYSCCHLQWHEYFKHGCSIKASYNKWKSEISKCICIYDVVQKYPHQCRYVAKLHCNHVETLTTVPVELVGCKSDKPLCKKMDLVHFSENMVQFTDKCDVVRMFNPGHGTKVYTIDSDEKER